ncbi:MAG: VanZ family protein [Lacibacter sp.]
MTQNIFRSVWPALLWPAFVCVTLLLPGRHLPSETLFPIPHFDKLIHAVLFYVLTYIWLQTAAAQKRLTRLVMAMLVCSAILYGLVLEWIQQFTGRDWDKWDALANTMGVLICVTIRKKLYKSNA